jgi:hypothetical protein
VSPPPVRQSRCKRRRRQSARRATTCRSLDVLYSKGTPSSAGLDIVPAFRHLAAPSVRSHVRDARKHDGHFCDCAVSWSNECRNTPERVDGIAWVRLIPARSAYGLIGQPAVLECNVRCKGARPSKVIELHNYGPEAFDEWAEGALGVDTAPPSPYFALFSQQFGRFFKLA